MLMARLTANILRVRLRLIDRCMDLDSYGQGSYQRAVLKAGIVGDAHIAVLIEGG